MTAPQAVTLANVVNRLVQDKLQNVISLMEAATDFQLKDNHFTAQIGVLQIISVKRIQNHIIEGYKY